MENEIASILEERTCFKKQYIRKYFKLNKKYDIPQDFLVDIKEGLYDHVIEPDDMFRDYLQLGLEVTTERITERGEIVPTRYFRVTRTKCLRGSLFL